MRRVDVYAAAPTGRVTRNGVPVATVPSPHGPALESHYSVGLLPSPYLLLVRVDTLSGFSSTYDHRYEYYIFNERTPDLLVQASPAIPELNHPRLLDTDGSGRYRIRPGHPRYGPQTTSTGIYNVLGQNLLHVPSDEMYLVPGGVVYENGHEVYYRSDAVKGGLLGRCARFGRKSG